MGDKIKEDVDSIKKNVRDNIYNFGNFSDVYKDQKEELIEIIKRFISLGESDSVLVVGPPNCGKSTVISECVNAVRSKAGDSFTVVRLNGLIHTNDNLALQEIIRCLHVEDLPEASYVSGTFADNLFFVLQSFKSGSRQRSKPILIIVDQFEYFCEHKNQTLLYNLFDVSVSAQAPLCLIGATCKLNVTEMFEKRVRSRFSQRQIALYPNNDLNYVVNLFKNTLLLNGKSKWNKQVENLFKSDKINKKLKKLTEYDVDYRLYQNILFSFTNKCDSNPTEDNIIHSIELFVKDRRVDLISDLSVLELCLVVAMKHHREIYDHMNFEMVYKKYCDFAVSSKVNLTERSVVFKAFERLVALEIVVPLKGHRRKLCKREYVLYSFVLTDNQVVKGVENYENLPTDIKQWASSSLNHFY